jgi:hypothetical protein
MEDTMTKRELIEALEASPAPDNARVFLVGSTYDEVVGSCPAGRVIETGVWVSEVLDDYDDDTPADFFVKPERGWNLRRYPRASEAKGPALKISYGLD